MSKMISFSFGLDTPITDDNSEDKIANRGLGSARMSAVDTDADKKAELSLITYSAKNDLSTCDLYDFQTGKISEAKSLKRSSGAPHKTDVQQNDRLQDKPREYFSTPSKTLSKVVTSLILNGENGVCKFYIKTLKKIRT